MFIQVVYWLKSRAYTCLQWFVLCGFVFEFIDAILRYMLNLIIRQHTMNVKNITWNSVATDLPVWSHQVKILSWCVTLRPITAQHSLSLYFSPFLLSPWNGVSRSGFLCNISSSYPRNSREKRVASSSDTRITKEDTFSVFFRFLHLSHVKKKYRIWHVAFWKTDALHYSCVTFE